MHDSSFVWSDGRTIETTAAKQFLVLSAGGAAVNTTPRAANLTVASSNQWRWDVGNGNSYAIPNSDTFIDAYIYTHGYTKPYANQNFYADRDLLIDTNVDFYANPYTDGHANGNIYTHTNTVVHIDTYIHADVHSNSNTIPNANQLNDSNCDIYSIPHADNYAYKNIYTNINSVTNADIYLHSDQYPNAHAE
jgi:hypothetical protein